VVKTANGLQAVLWTSGWTPKWHGETIYLARDLGNGGEDHTRLVRIRPEDLDAGGMETVFPWRKSDGEGTTPESRGRFAGTMMGVRTRVLVIRITPTAVTRVYCAGLRTRAGHQLRCARWPLRSADPPLGRTDVLRGDHGSSGPHLLHRR